MKKAAKARRAVKMAPASCSFDEASPAYASRVPCRPRPATILVLPVDWDMMLEGEDDQASRAGQDALIFLAVSEPKACISS